jgi:hypothetical protein
VVPIEPETKKVKAHKNLKKKKDLRARMVPETKKEYAGEGQQQFNGLYKGYIFY